MLRAQCVKNQRRNWWLIGQKETPILRLPPPPLYFGLKNKAPICARNHNDPDARLPPSPCKNEWWQEGGCSQLLEPHWGCLIDKCAVFHGLLCLLLPEGTPHWYWKIKRAVSEYCSPFEILHEVFAGEKLFVLLLKQQNKSCFHGIMTNSPIILGNATSQKATPAPNPLLSDFSATQFATLARLQQ